MAVGVGGMRVAFAVPFTARHLHRIEQASAVVKWNSMQCNAT